MLDTVIATAKAWLDDNVQTRIRTELTLQARHDDPVVQALEDKIMSLVEIHDKESSERQEAKKDTIPHAVSQCRSGTISTCNSAAKSLTSLRGQDD